MQTARKPPRTGRSRKTGAADAANRPAPTRRPRERAPVTAETLGAKQREISVSEFFAKNRHLLGFDNPRKALLTSVKEAVDNSLDACEEARILPDVSVRIENLAEVAETRFRITVEDNGPGVVRKQIEGIFGRLLYGSKFHRLKMARGQQGIGISAAGMYGLMTTGRPMVITTRPKKGRPAHHVELAMDTTRNRPEVTIDRETEDFPDHTGTRVVIELEGRYMRGRGSVDAYLEQTAIANPHAQITYFPPAKGAEASEEDEALLPEVKGADPPSTGAPSRNGALERTTAVGDAVVFPRTVQELPPEPEEIKPHPHGIELGTLMQMLKQTEHRQMGGFLTGAFSKVSPRAAQEICEKAGLTPHTWVAKVGHREAEAVHRAIQQVKLQSPPLNCLAPIGTRQILAGLLKGVRAEFYAAGTRPPAVYRGNPFQIEAGVAYGGDLPGEEPARVIRFANRVPLLYQQSACSAFKAVVETAWRNYGLSQPKGSVPAAPLVVMVHMASVWVPFTSESKEAIADYDEIRKEMRLALQECGRKLASYVRRRERIRREGARRDAFERYIGEVARALATIDPSIDAASVKADLERVASRRTEMADVELDDEGKPRAAGPEKPDDDTIIVESAMRPALEEESPDAPPVTDEPAPAPRKRRKKPEPEEGGEPRAARPARARRTKPDDDADSDPQESLF